MNRWYIYTNFVYIVCKCDHQFHFFITDTSRWITFHHSIVQKVSPSPSTKWSTVSCTKLYSCGKGSCSQRLSQTIPTSGSKCNCLGVYSEAVQTVSKWHEAHCLCTCMKWQGKKCCITVVQFHIHELLIHIGDEFFMYLLNEWEEKRNEEVANN